jgi:hypothetical protein
MTDHSLHLYLVAQGSYQNTDLKSEIWETGVRMAFSTSTIDDIGTFPTSATISVVGATVARTETDWTIDGDWKLLWPLSLHTFQPDDYLNDVAAPAFVEWMAACHISSGVNLQTLKLSVCESPNGKESPPPPIAVGTPMLLTFTTTTTGGDSGNVMPLQDSIVASHQGYQNGPRGRGRMYLPPSGTASVSGGRVSTGAQSDILAGHVALLQALEGTFGTVGVKPVVTGKPFTDYSVIQSVSVDNVYDTQKRRRNRLSSTRSHATV